MNEYRVFYNEDYVLSSIERYRRQKHVYPWFIAVKIVCALGLSALLAIIVYAVTTSMGSSGPLLGIAVVIVAFLFLLLQGPRIDYIFLKRRLRRSPFYGDEMHILVSAAGVSLNTPRSQTTSKWSAFTKVRRLSSGFLVFTDPTTFHWWPDSALSTGAITEVEHLLRANIAAYQGGDV
jgi:hypothetical protein